MKRPLPLMFERLEEKVLLSALFVTDSSIAPDTTHFNTLSAAVAAAAAGSSITILDGAVPEITPVTVATLNLSIQGDSRLAATSLARYSLTLAASGITLSHLAIGALVINATANTETVRSCDIYSVTEIGDTPTGNGGDVFTSNVIHGQVALQGNTGSGVATNDSFTHNTLVTEADPALWIINDSGINVSDNTVNSLSGDGCFFESSEANITIARNTISAGTIAVTIRNGVSSGLISENDFSVSAPTGTNLSLHGTNGALRVQGNSFSGGQTGIIYIGDGVTASIPLDVGAGALSSLGGNDFSTYSGVNNSYAISLAGVPVNAIMLAYDNMYGGSSGGTDTVSPGNGPIHTSGLSVAAAQVTTVYHFLLRRMPSSADVTYWSGVFSGQGQAAMVNSILHSNEALSRLVDSYYRSYLGRGGDAAGLAYWVGTLQAGGTLEAVQSQILGSVEFITGHNTDFVQSLYRMVLGRVADGPGISYWYGQLPSIGLTGVAAAIVNSTENRTNFLNNLFQKRWHAAPSPGDVTRILGNGADELAIISGVLGPF